MAQKREFYEEAIPKLRGKCDEKWVENRFLPFDCVHVEFDIRILVSLFGIGIDWTP